VDRVLNAAGRTSAQQRAGLRQRRYASAPGHADQQVATAPTQVTDADFAAAKAAGFTEDQLFELVIAAAVGQSARLYEAGLAALAEAAGHEEGR
jgi:alkylhydroperoxidase family enzyme